MNRAETLRVTTPSDCEMRMTRVFAAPRQQVYALFTKPELWFGSPVGTVTVYENDRKPGGKFRWVLHTSGKKDTCVHGTFLEMEPFERSVAMETIEGSPIEWRVTVVFTETEGKTTLTATVLYPSRDIRDKVLQSGIILRADQSYDRLEAALTQAE